MLIFAEFENVEKKKKNSTNLMAPNQSLSGTVKKQRKIEKA
jgi:hypothetical protein